MKYVKIYLGLLAFSFLFLTGCDEDNISITQEEDSINSTIQDTQFVSKSTNGKKSFASGQGGFIFNEKHANFAFHASMDSDGSIKGQWEAKTVGLNLRTHGTITCLTFLDDKTAVMSGTITQVNKDDGTWSGAEVGNSIWFKVVDNGEGNIDQFSDYYIDEGGCIDYNPALSTIENGNIQVKRKIENVVDIEGNEYNVVQIGSQIWMAENLRTTTYNDGTAISNVPGILDWISYLSGAYSWYNNDEVAFKETYGALYNGYCIETGKLAPKGWHVASDEEWQILTDYIGSSDIAGGKLKERGTSHWDSPNIDATNNYGFFALPGGHRWTNGSYFDNGVVGSWWSSTISGNPENYINRWIRNEEGKINISGYPKNVGFSVRCVKN